MSISDVVIALRVGTTLLSVLLLSVPIAEGVFRMSGDESSPDMRGLFAAFDKGTYKLSTSVDTYAFYASGRVTVSTDGLGLRCDAARRHAAKPYESVDVLLLGDSQGFGNGVSFEDSIAGSLAELECPRGRRVVNASVGGHSLATQYEVARWLIETQGVKVANVVLLLTPAMIQQGNRLNQATVGDDGRLYGGKPSLSTWMLLWLKTHLVTYSRMRDAIRNGIGFSPTETLPLVFEYYRSGGNAKAVHAELLAGMETLQGFAHRHGANVHLVYVPLTVEIEFDPVRQAAAKSGLYLDADIPSGVASSVADNLRVPFYSLRPVLRHVHDEGSQLKVKADFHYSPILSRACGADLASRLKVHARESWSSEDRGKAATP